MTHPLHLYLGQELSPKFVCDNQQTVFSQKKNSSDTNQN